MAASSLRCCCPHCGGRTVLKDARLLGRKIKCPQYGKPFLVRESDEDESPLDDEERDERPGRGAKKTSRKPPRKQKSRLLLWLLLAGGGVALLAVVGVVVVLGRGGWGGGPFAKPADWLVDVSGPFPDLPGPAPGGSTVLFHVVLVGESVKLSGSDCARTEGALLRSLLAVAGPGANHVMRGTESGTGPSRHLSIYVGPIRETAATLAPRIPFGTVRGVSGQVITLVVHKEELVPAQPAP